VKSQKRLQIGFLKSGPTLSRDGPGPQKSDPRISAA